jgi:hypothetical protein
MPTIKTCRECHGGSRPVEGKVTSNCLLCHNFHDARFPWDPLFKKRRRSVWRSASAALAARSRLLATSCGGGGSAGEAPCINLHDAAETSWFRRTCSASSRGRWAKAQARGIRAHIAVVDRVGNVLAVFSMTGAPATVAISGGRGVNGGLDGIPQGTIPATLSAISKAITGAYLSSQGNAFSTRTAGQIVQEFFNPGERGQPSGPLYGVQFSQLRAPT